MYTYEKIESEFLNGIKRSDGAFLPLDPANSDYAEYQRYTEWVEAGNNPDDFWSQSEDFLSEGSQPNGEEI